MRRLAPFAVVMVTVAALVSAEQRPPAAGPAPTARERALAIVARMTLDEKIDQLHGIRTGTEYRTVPDLPRLGIPKLLLTNGPAGMSYGGVVQPKATALPAAIALAATFDLAAADAFGDIQGREVLHVGRNVLEAPTVNIVRVPVAGRNFESYGEDPYLAARFAVHNIRAVQAHGVIGNVKHYLANNQEVDRRTVSSDMAERTMREIYLPAFEASVKEARVGSIMCAYNKVNGVYNCENRTTMTDILKREWGFDGFVLSDFGAVHSTVPSSHAGLDLETPIAEYFTGTALRTALDAGVVTPAEIDEKLVRRYTKMIEFGLFDRASTVTPIPAARHGEVARRVAAQGMVLLKNAAVGRAPVLPLAPGSLRSIALIGSDAAKTGGGGSSRVIPLYTVNPSQGIRSQAGPGVRVTTNPGTSLKAAAAAARAATVAVVTVQDSATEGRDRPDLALPGNQDALVAAVVRANPRTVVVLKTSGPVLMPWLGRVPAVLQAWYPGQEDGNAVADVLFGRVNPSGRLPVTFPARAADQPARTRAQYPGVGGIAYYSEGIFVGYRHYDARGIAPLFPFGHGLSYTGFTYANLRVGQGAGAQVSVEADITNSGGRPGAEVVQLYVGSPAPAHIPEAPRELQGFQKISLAPGQTGHVRFTLDERSFSYWDSTAHRWRVTAGEHRVQLGGSSRDPRLTGTVTLQAG